MTTSKYIIFKHALVAALAVFSFALFSSAAKTEDGKAAKTTEVEKEKKETEPTPSGVGPEKAITHATVKDGLRLSDEAIKTMEIKMVPITVMSAGTVKIPSKSILHYQADSGVYRLREGWFKLIEGKILSRTSSDVIFQSKDSKNLTSSDQVVTDGAQLLRLGELNIWSGGGDAD